MVSVRRSFSDGTVRVAEAEAPLLMEKAPSVVSSETSVAIFNEIRPSESTTGVKLETTPKA